MIINDEFVSDKYIETFKDLTLSSNSISWFFNASTGMPDEDRKFSIEDQKTHENFQMMAPITASHPQYAIIKGLFDRFLYANNISYNKILRIKFNLISRNSDFPVGGYNTPHIDANENHLVFLYYVNDSDGDTVFFDQTFENKSVDQLTEKVRISPKAGRGMIFNGLRYHASSPPIKSAYRCVLNIDFTSDSVVEV